VHTDLSEHWLVIPYLVNRKGPEKMNMFIELRGRVVGEWKWS